jgi:hypothetical protein
MAFSIAIIRVHHYNRVMDDVSEQRYEKERLWVQTWQKAGEVLGELRRREVRHVDTARAILQLEDAFHSALRERPPEPTSGLVEQQHWFARWKR